LREQERLLANLKRNREKRLKRRNPVARLYAFILSFKWWLALAAAALAFVFALPGKMNSFWDDSRIVLNRFDQWWLEPSLWSGRFDSAPEGIVDVSDLELTTGSDIVIDINILGHVVDGALYSLVFCEMGSFSPSALIEGQMNYFYPNRLNLRVYDFVNGRQVDLGAISIVRDGEVLDLMGIEPEHIRLARDYEEDSILTESQICPNSVGIIKSSRFYDDGR
jgi:hypothetical protein